MFRLNMRLAFLVLMLALSLSSCTWYLRPGGGYGYGQGDIISVFMPDRGEGASYFVGETVSFRFHSRLSGYVTLSAIDPDGAVYVLEANLPVVAGQMMNFPNGRSSYRLVPPAGLHRVRAAFSPSRTAGNYNQLQGSDLWTQRIVTELEPYPADQRAVAETYFYLR
ncbi:MAG: DUF4384 domain-containing protein [Deinococcales bacterium]